MKFLKLALIFIVFIGGIFLAIHGNSFFQEKHEALVDEAIMKMDEKEICISYLIAIAQEKAEQAERDATLASEKLKQSKKYWKDLEKEREDSEYYMKESKYYMKSSMIRSSRKNIDTEKVKNNLQQIERHRSFAFTSYQGAQEAVRQIQSIQTLANELANEPERKKINRTYQQAKNAVTELDSIVHWFKEWEPDMQRMRKFIKTFERNQSKIESENKSNDRSRDLIFALIATKNLVAVRNHPQYKKAFTQEERIKIETAIDINKYNKDYKHKSQKIGRARSRRIQQLIKEMPTTNMNEIEALQTEIIKILNE